VVLQRRPGSFGEPGRFASTPHPHTVTIKLTHYPAMAAKLTDRVWTVHDQLDLLDSQ
jgi:hypothetical protein